MNPEELPEEYSTRRFNRIGFEIKRNKMITFQIIPHANISNNTKRLWRVIHKMYEMYEAPRNRLERNKLRFTLREKDLFWFDIVFKQVEDEKHVLFYVTTTEYQAEKLKRKIENKLHVTFKDATPEELFVPYKNTTVQELKYLNHDIFSLNHNVTDKKTPIGNLLAAVEELQFDGDFARFSVCNEVESRNKWVKSAQWAYEKASNGKVPQRAKVNSKMVTNYLKMFVAYVVNELNDLITDIFQAIQNAFLKSEKNFDTKKVIKSAYSVEDETGTTRINREKGNTPVFRSHIRVVAHSDNRIVRDTLSESIALSMQDLTDTNELVGYTVTSRSNKKRIINELNTFKLSKQTQFDPNVNLISTDEMSKIALMFPNRELQREYEDVLNVKKRIETVIPTVVQDSNALLVGYSQVKDRKIPVGLPVHRKNDFYCGYAFVGRQGSGKDTAIQNVSKGAAEKGISMFILDWVGEEGHKGLADGVRDLLPPEKVIDLDMANDNYSIPMDLSEVVRKLGRKGGSRFAFEMADFFRIEGLTRSRKYLTEASKASNGSLLNMKRIIEDEEYRAQRIEELEREGNRRLAHDLKAWGSNEKLANKCDPILERLDRLFGDDTLYDIFSQEPLPELDFEQFMREGKTVIIRMPKRILGNAVKALAHWITLKVFMTRMLMSKEDKEKHGCFIVFNEPEQVESEGLSELMGRIATEGRKECLGSIFAFHHWNKLPTHLQDNLIAGGVNQFLLASDHKKTFELVKERLEPTFTVEEAMKTPKEYAIALLSIGEPLPAFLVHMLPPVPAEERYDNSFLTRRHVRMYGRSWEELQARIPV